jgi:hypothetical protein
MALMVMLSGCASILSGTTQTTTIETKPDGARCEVVRDGKVVASVNKTPGSVSFPKTNDDAELICKKEGFNDVKVPMESGIDGWSAANIILFPTGTVIGYGIDSSTGAINAYPEKASVDFHTGKSSTDVDEAKAKAAANPKKKKHGV